MDCKHEGEIIVERIVSQCVSRNGDKLIVHDNQEDNNPRTFCNNCGEELCLEDADTFEVPPLHIDAYTIRKIT